MTTGFTIKPLAESNRVQQITLSAEIIKIFKEAVTNNWDVQSIEYKPFLRFAIADILDDACQHTLGETLRDILHNRDQAAFVISYEKTNLGFNTLDDEKNFYVLFSTAISHHIGIPNHDSMYGNFYARFMGSA